MFLSINETPIQASLVKVCTAAPKLSDALSAMVYVSHCHSTLRGAAVSERQISELPVTATRIGECSVVFFLFLGVCVGACVCAGEGGGGGSNNNAAVQTFRT